MNSASKTMGSALKINTGPVGTHGSCVRMRNGLLSIILMISAIASSGCQGKPKAGDTPAKTTERSELTVASKKEKIRRDTLNQVGSIANDFRYIDRDGVEGSLHDLQCRHLLLIFYNPECPHCAPLIKKKASNRKINADIEKGELTVLAVYAEGNRDIWEKTKADMPQNWIVAYDLTGVLDHDLYDLPAMPYAFALSADKRVVIKDMPL